MLFYQVRTTLTKVLQKQHEIACDCRFVPRAFWACSATKGSHIDFTDDWIYTRSTAELLVFTSNDLYSAVDIGFMQYQLLQGHNTTCNPGLPHTQVNGMPTIHLMEPCFTIDSPIHQQKTCHRALSFPGWSNCNSMGFLHSNFRCIP